MLAQDRGDAVGLVARMLDRDPLDRAVLAEAVDDAPVRDRRHGETSDAAQRRLDVQRAREHLAGAGEEAQALHAPLPLGHLGLRLRVEHRVVDREGGALGELEREREILVIQAPAGVHGRAHRDRTEGATARHERDGQERRRPELPVQPAVLLVERDVVERRLRPLGLEVRLVGRDDARHGVRRVSSTG